MIPIIYWILRMQWSLKSHHSKTSYIQRMVLHEHNAPAFSPLKLCSSFQILLPLSLKLVVRCKAFDLPGS